MPKSRHLAIENGGCFTHLFLTHCQFLCNYLLKHKLTRVVLWKLFINSANFTDRVIFCVSSWVFYLSPKISFHKCRLWQIPCLVKNDFGSMYCIFSRFNFNKFNQIAHHLWATSGEKPLSEQASIKPKWPKLQQISSDMPCIIIINDKHSSLLSLPAVASFSRTSILYIIH